MAAKLLDAYALLAFFEDEPGADLVRSRLLKAEESDLKLLMNVVNLGEVWYSIARASSPHLRPMAGLCLQIVLRLRWQKSVEPKCSRVTWSLRGWMGKLKFPGLSSSGCGVAQGAKVTVPFYDVYWEICLPITSNPPGQPQRLF